MMMSPISFIIVLLIMIIIPTILYSFFFLINCPTTPFELFGRRPCFNFRGSKTGEGKTEDDENDNDNIQMVVGKSYELGKETECPVCLSVFAEGEKLKQIKICKHLFHKSCIDKWLSSHFNCPVCRAFVGNQSKAKESENSRGIGIGRDDLWQGLPDSAGLI